MPSTTGRPYLTEKKKTYKLAFESESFLSNVGFGHSWQIEGKADRLTAQRQNTDNKKGTNHEPSNYDN